MIQVSELKKVYSGVVVVNIPALEIRKGESIGLVGNNGAGKTTLFRMILDLIRPEAGRVLSGGEPVAGNEHWKDYTASYLDETFLIDYLTPEEYFYFIGGLHQQSRAHVDDFLTAYSDFFNGEILQRGKYIRDLSKGNQTKVGIVACLLQNPAVLLLDEPFANIDPTTQFRLKNIIKQCHQKGITTLVSSHDLNHVTEVCDRILLMERGRIIKDMATSSSTLAELEQYFAIGETGQSVKPVIDPEENH